MMVSRVVFALLVGGVLSGAVAGSGCNVSISSKTRYVGEQPIVKATAADWAGEPITINIAGVGVAVNGGVTVTADPTATRITATANFVALAVQKPDADASITDAENTFNVTTDSTGVNVVCDHGQTHGGSDSGESGCELVTIVIPAGAVGRGLTLKVLSGNGDQTLNLAPATITNLGTNQNGTGSIIATLPATQGGSISLVSQQAGDVTATMPQGFSANEIILQADPDKIQNAFTDAKLGAGAGGIGTPNAGLVSLKLTSTSFAGSTGTVTLH